MAEKEKSSKADGPGEALVDEPTAEALETREESADESEWEKAATDRDGEAPGDTGDSDEDASGDEPQDESASGEPPG